MNNFPEVSHWGFFTLVSYVPDPLGSFLQQLRLALPGDDIPQPHITFLPPRPLNLPIDAASCEARTILRDFAAFDVELSRVRTFAETKFLYLDLGEGNSLVHDLHDALNTGDLANHEEFEFHPHLTLGGPFSPASLDPARRQLERAWSASHCSPRFTIEEIVFLWQSPTESGSGWRRLWTHQLNAGSASRATAAALTNRTW